METWTCAKCDFVNANDRYQCLVCGGEKSTEQYLIFSRCHSRGIATWWGPDRAGYVQNVDMAGRYSKEEAEKIVKSSDRGEEMWPLSRVESMHIRRIIDMGDTVNRPHFYPKSHE